MCRQTVKVAGGLALLLALAAVAVFAASGTENIQPGAIGQIQV